MMTYTDDIQHIDDDWPKDDSLFLEVKVVFETIPADDHPGMIPHFLIGRVVLEDNNILKSSLRWCTVFSIDVKSISAALIHWNCEVN